jgi:hypothetical protein
VRDLPMRRSHRVMAVVEPLVLILLWPNQVRPVDDAMASVEDRPQSLPRIGARR